MGKEKRVPLLVGASGLGASHLLLGGLNLLLFLLKEASKTVLGRLQQGEQTRSSNSKTAQEELQFHSQKGCTILSVVQTENTTWSQFLQFLEFHDRLR